MASVFCRGISGEMDDGPPRSRRGAAKIWFSGSWYSVEQPPINQSVNMMHIRSSRRLGHISIAFEGERLLAVHTGRLSVWTVLSRFDPRGYFFCLEIHQEGKLRPCGAIVGIRPAHNIIYPQSTRDRLETPRITLNGCDSQNCSCVVCQGL